VADLIETVEDGIATVLLNRPESRNAVNAELCDALLETLSRLAVREDVGVVVLTGAGNAFCAGGDVKRMPSIGRQDPDARIANIRRWGRIGLLLHTMPKVTIAMVNGIAAGAGFSMALGCDMRIAGRSARFATAYVRMGLTGDFGGSHLVQRLVGSAKARELYLLGDTITAAEALAIGLVSRVTEDDQLAAETGALARRLADGPRTAHAMIKQNLYTAETATLAEVIDLEATHQVQSSLTDDHREAVAAFQERRKPVFGR
jgi:2-(1,2-epoxy-1,2-dihydrophenyl)acetyl-CoA isomerase